MYLVDANVLIYAVNTSAPHHERSRTWLDRSISGEATVAFAWVALLAFVRLVTKPEIFASPLSVDAAFERVDAWLSAPTAVVVEPTARHARTMASLLAPLGTAGNLTNDAHLAALAIEHHCTVVSFDTDYARFADVVWQLPDSGA
jgi:toxin-antitoxin system PIN domain toxin